ncbi:MAG: alpha-ketoacid dehydrogenase subunit beta [Acidimicrobiia bacterium]
MVQANDATVEMTYREAIRTALDDELAGDPSVVLLGEDIAKAGGPFKTSEGLYEKYGGDRLIDTPISENGFTGAALGMSLTGMRPVVEIMFSDFLPTAFDAIAMQLPKWRFMSGGQVSLPITIRASGGAGGRFGAQTSSTGESWLLQFFGLQIAVAGSPQSAYGLLRTAIRHNNPVIVFEHKALHAMKGPVNRGDTELPELGRAEVVREGSDVTVVGSLLMVQRSLEAAELLEGEQIFAEVIDIRWVRPLDVETIRASVEKTGRLVVVEEQYHDGGWGASVISRLTTGGHRWKVPPVLVTMPSVLISHSPPIEDQTIPSVEKIVTAVRDAVSS